jgi:hypothetical protein
VKILIARNLNRALNRHVPGRRPLWRAPGDAPVRVMAEESGPLSNTVRRELDDEAERLTAFRD